MHVRQIVMGDAPAVQAIYAPFVTATTISFEEVPPDIMEVERRIAAILPHYPYLVAEVDGRVVGYAQRRAGDRQLIGVPAARRISVPACSTGDAGDAYLSRRDIWSGSVCGSSARSTRRSR